jgi:hypothetical protein
LWITVDNTGICEDKYRGNKRKLKEKGGESKLMGFTHTLTHRCREGVGSL